jgi:16S rRNA (cytosine967-C5)-methyltransferase
LSAPTPARRAAYEVLRRVFEHGAWADRSLRSAAERFKLEGRDRAQAQSLAYGAVQRRGTTDWLIAELTGRPLERIDAALLAALRLGLYELLFAEGADHAAVDQAVELAKGGRDGGRRHRGAGLVNAVLRRASREADGMLDGLDDGTAAGASIRHSMPEWIASLWFEERGAETARAMMLAANEPPRRTYRVAGASEPAGMRAIDPAADGLPGLEGVRLVESGDEPDWEAVEAAVARGELVPQSAGSALAAAALGVEPGQKVLDLCAAPGIKTTQLAAAAGADGSVTAVERDSGRASTLRELCERVGAGNVTVLEGDALRLDIGGGYDRVLVDAPCTGLGTLAARPDARWHRRRADIEGLTLLQRDLLGKGLGALRPGGRAMYSVCTVSRAESEAVAESAGAEVLDLTALAPTAAEAGCPGSLQLLPGAGAGEGFFIAALEPGGAS